MEKCLPAAGRENEELEKLINRVIGYCIGVHNFSHFTPLENEVL